MVMTRSLHCLVTSSHMVVDWLCLVASCEMIQYMLCDCMIDYIIPISQYFSR